jgi:hypothetical protein
VRSLTEAAKPRLPKHLEERVQRLRVGLVDLAEPGRRACIAHSIRPARNRHGDRPLRLLQSTITVATARAR